MTQKRTLNSTLRAPRPANTLLAAGLLLAVPALYAAERAVTVTNLTRATWFTPMLVSSHPASFQSFTEGSPASVEIQRVAEAGDASGVLAQLPAGA